MTLVAVEGETCRVRVQSDAGRTPESSEHALRFVEGALPSSAQAKVGGKETLTVAGQEYSCVIWQAEVQVDAETLQATEWWTDGVALPVKKVSKSRNGSHDTEMTAVAIGERVQAAGQSLTCVRYNVRTQSGGVSTSGTTLLSADVPGGTVRIEQEMKMPGLSAQMTMELLAFSGSRHGAAPVAAQPSSPTDRPPEVPPSPGAVTEEVRGAVEAFEKEFADRGVTLHEFRLDQARAALAGGSGSSGAVAVDAGFVAATSASFTLHATRAEDLPAKVDLQEAKGQVGLSVLEGKYVNARAGAADLDVRYLVQVPWTAKPGTQILAGTAIFRDGIGHEMERREFSLTVDVRASAIQVPEGALSRDQLGTLFAQARAAQAQAKTWLDKVAEYTLRSITALGAGVEKDKMEESLRESERLREESLPYQVLSNAYVGLRDMLLHRILDQAGNPDRQIAAMAPVLVERVFGRWEPLNDTNGRRK